MATDALFAPRCYLDQDMAEAELHAFAGGAAVVFSSRCPTKATANEDSAALIPFGERSGVLVVADGLGGSIAGEHASRIAVETLKSAVAAAAREGQMLRSAILDGFEQANAAVQALNVGAATTLAVVEIDEHTMRPYHAGDSPILVVGGRGKIKLQTVAHSPVGYAVESGLLTALDAMQHEDRHIVSNVVGMPGMRIEIGPTLELAARDTVLLASDGLHDNLHDDEIIARICKGALPRVAAQLATDARARMTGPLAGAPSKPDDLTFVMFRPKAGRSPTR